jgi:hypothetical protein
MALLPVDTAKSDKLCLLYGSPLLFIARPCEYHNMSITDSLEHVTSVRYSVGLCLRAGSLGSNWTGRLFDYSMETRMNRLIKFAAERLLCLCYT